MTDAKKNLCLVCETNQGCCSDLRGLRLSDSEFASLFAVHEESLSVIKCNRMRIVSSRDRRPCPYWRQDGCSIYHDRPFDCRFYPFEIKSIRAGRKSVRVSFRLNSGCPQRESLAMPLAEARSLIEHFCRETYGGGKPCRIRYLDDNYRQPLYSRLFEAVAAQCSRVLRSRRFR